MPTPPIPQYTVMINHVLDPTLVGYITEVIVDTSVFMPSMCTITLEDKMDIPGLLKFVDNPLYRLGASVDVSVTNVARGLDIPTVNVIFSGEITSIEPVFTEGGSVHFKLRAMDQGHRMTLGKKTRAFGGTPSAAPIVSDIEIVAKIAGENGLIPKTITPPGVTYHYVMQYNQSDWDFLWSRAQMLGCEMYVEGKVLNFVMAGTPRIAPPAILSWQENLLRFEPRIVSSGLAAEVEVQNWDPSLTRKHVGKGIPYVGPAASKIAGGLPPGFTAVKAAFSAKAKDTIIEPAAETPVNAVAFASARMGEHESSFVRASGVALGHPGLLAGVTVPVKNVGTRFSGTYYITEARHILRGGDYSVQFQVSGRHPYTVRQLLLGKDSSAAQKIHGVVVGLVTNNNDLEMTGRVKVKFPWVDSSGMDLESGWARVALPGGGADRGIYYLPEINDEVLVAFEHGDVSHPYIVGSLYSRKNKPPKGGAGVVVAAGKVNQRIIRSRSGHLIVLDDTQGAEKILIQDKGGKSSIEFDATMRSVTIKSEGDLVLDAGGKVTVKSKQDFALEAQTGAALKVSSNELTLQPSGAALKGTKVDVQGQGPVAIQGATASVKGSGMVEIQGGVVKIN